MNLFGSGQKRRGQGVGLCGAAGGACRAQVCTAGDGTMLLTVVLGFAMHVRPSNGLVRGAVKMLGPPPPRTPPFSKRAPPSPPAQKAMPMVDGSAPAARGSGFPGAGHRPPAARRFSVQGHGTAVCPCLPMPSLPREVRFQEFVGDEAAGGLWSAVYSGRLGPARNGSEHHAVPNKQAAKVGSLPLGGHRNGWSIR